jgi:hypothetical protein
VRGDGNTSGMKRIAIDQTTRAAQEKEPGVDPWLAPLHQHSTDQPSFA